MKTLVTGLCVALGLTMASQAQAETTECTEITSIPIVITVQGVYCLKSNLATGMTSGNAIDIQTNNVTIDFNGFKLGGLAAGTGTNATGISAQSRRNIVLRNGSVRGFRYGIWLSGNASTSSGHLIEDMILDNNRQVGIQAQGNGMVVRNNRVVNTGPTDLGSEAYGITILNARNSLISGNLVSRTTETGTAYGMYLAASAMLEIHRNSILETDGGATSDIGIYLINMIDSTILDNRVLNESGSGTTGIIDGLATSSGINCIGNTIAGFSTAVSGCDNDIGNNKL